MKLVTIILLLCVHSADSGECEGKKNLLVFCDAGDNLKIKITTTNTVTWTLNNKALPPNHTAETDATETVMNLPSLAAEDTGLYTATYDPSMTDKFTIIVGAAVTCTKEVTCKVGNGASIKLDSGLTGTASWTFTATGSDEAPVNDPEKFTATDKKVLGLFDVNTSGNYKATASAATAEFPVTVSERARVSSVKIESQGGKVRVCPSAKVILECTVTGDAKSYSWTKDNTAVDSSKVDTAVPGKLTISSVTPDHAGSYTCKVLGYFSDALVDSPSVALEVQDTQVSNVRITRKGSVLTCEATGAVKKFEWEMEDGTKVSSQHGVVGNVKSQLNLTLKAKGNFVCKAIGCDDKGVNSDVCVVGEDHGDNKGSGGPGPTSLPGRGPQGASTSVALLLISVLVELYVMML